MTTLIIAVAAALIAAGATWLATRSIHEAKESMLKQEIKVQKENADRMLKQ